MCIFLSWWTKTKKREHVIELTHSPKPLDPSSYAAPEVASSLLHHTELHQAANSFPQSSIKPSDSWKTQASALETWHRSWDDIVKQFGANKECDITDLTFYPSKGWRHGFFYDAGIIVYSSKFLTAECTCGVHTRSTPLYGNFKTFINKTWNPSGEYDHIIDIAEDCNKKGTERNLKVPPTTVTLQSQFSVLEDSPEDPSCQVESSSSASPSLPLNLPDANPRCSLIFWLYPRWSLPSPVTQY